jgi:hypothetical protein
VDDFQEAWRKADPKIRAEMLYRWGVHEAGHAVARWTLDRMNYIGHPLPVLRHVAISLDGGPIPGSRGLHTNLNGVCAAHPCFFWPWRAPLPRSCPTPPRMVRRLVTADVAHTMAGPIAEKIHDGEPYADADHWLCEESELAWIAEDGEEGTDSWQVERCIALFGRRWRLHLDRAFALADQIVRTHQPHIHALAKALTERGLIEGEEIKEIFARVEQ